MNKIFLQALMILMLFLTSLDAQTPLEYLNDKRIKAGMSTLISNTYLHQSSQNHADYVKTNIYTLGYEGHYETSGATGYTGYAPWDRARNVGYETSASENMTVGYNDYNKSIDALFTAIYHRLGFFDFYIDEIGYGESINTQSGDIYTHVYNMGNMKLNLLCDGISFNQAGSYYNNVCTDPNFKIDTTLYNNEKNENSEENPDIVVWPYENQVDFQPAFFEESPDPLPTCSVSGNPISIQFNPVTSGNISMQSFKLYDANNSEITDLTLLNSVTDPNSRLSSKEYVIFPNERLGFGEKYKTEFIYTDDGVSKTKSWEFYTRALDHDYYVVTDTNTNFNVVSGKDYYVYVPPTDCNDTRFDMNTTYTSSTPPVMEIIDGNLLKFTVQGSLGQYAEVTLNNGKVIRGTIATTDTAIDHNVSIDFDQVLVDSGFTQEYLNDKTFYGIFNWKDSATSPDNFVSYKVIFNSNGTISNVNTPDGNFTENYTVVDGLVKVGSIFDWNLTAVSGDYLTVNKINHDAGENRYDTLEEYLFYNENNATKHFLGLKLVEQLGGKTVYTINVDDNSLLETATFDANLTSISIVNDANATPVLESVTWYIDDNHVTYITFTGPNGVNTAVADLSNLVDGNVTLTFDGTEVKALFIDENVAREYFNIGITVQGGFTAGWLNNRILWTPSAEEFKVYETAFVDGNQSFPEGIMLNNQVYNQPYDVITGNNGEGIIRVDEEGVQWEGEANPRIAGTYEYYRILDINGTKISVCDSEDLNFVKSCTEVTQLFYTNQTDAQAYLNELSGISVQTGFTQSYLNDKTFYGIFNWKDSATSPDNFVSYKVIFNSNGTISNVNTPDGNFTENYTVLNGLVKIGDIFDWNVTAVSAEYITVNKINHDSGENRYDTLEEYLYFDENKSQEAFTTVNVINVDTQEHNLTKVDFNSTTRNYDLALDQIVDGNNTYQTIMDDGNYTATVYEKLTDSYTADWFYNFEDNKLYPESNDTNQTFVELNTTINLELNSSHWRYYKLHVNTPTDKNITQVNMKYIFGDVEFSDDGNGSNHFTINYSEKGMYALELLEDNNTTWYFNEDTGDLNTTFDSNSHMILIGGDVSASIDLNVTSSVDNNDTNVTVNNSQDMNVSGFTLHSTFEFQGSSEYKVKFDKNDTLHVIYRNAQNVIELKKYNDSNWTDVGPIIFSSGSGYNPDLSFDRNSQPYVTYLSVGQGGTHQGVTVKKLNNNSWEPLGPVSFSEDSSWDPSITFDQNDTAYISYRHSSGVYQSRIKAFSSGSWIEVGLGSPDNIDFNAAVHFDLNNTPYYLYKEWGNSGTSTAYMIHVLQSNNNNWSELGIATLKPSIQDLDSIMTSDNALYISYCGTTDPTTSAARYLAVKKFNGTNWENLANTEIVNSGQATAISMQERKLDGNILVSYQHYDTNNKVSVKEYDGVHWTDYGYIQTDGASSSQMILDSQGNAYIAFIDSDTLYLYKSINTKTINIQNVNTQEHNLTAVDFNSTNENYSLNVVGINDGNASYDLNMTDGNYTAIIHERLTDNYVADWFYNFQDNKLYPESNDTNQTFVELNTTINLELNSSNWQYYKLKVNTPTDKNFKQVNMKYVFGDVVFSADGNGSTSSFTIEYSEKGMYALELVEDNDMKWYYDEDTGDLNNTFDPNSHMILIGDDVNATFDLNVTGNADNNETNATFSQAKVSPQTKQLYKVWEKRYGLSNAGDYGHKVIKTSDGNIVTIGYINNNHLGTSNDTYVKKFSPGGTELWSQNIGGSNTDNGHDIEETTDGGFIVSGQSYNGSNFDTWVVKLDASGNKTWEKIFANASYETSYSIVEVSTGGYVFTRQINNDGSYIVKIDTNGNEVWSSKVGWCGSDNLHSVTETFDGGFVASGFTFCSEANSGEYAEDFAIAVKVDSNGNELWKKSYVDYHSNFYNVKELKSKELMFAGYRTPYDNSATDAWLVKTDQNGTVISENSYRKYGDPYDYPSYPIEDKIYDFIETDDNKTIFAGCVGQTAQGYWSCREAWIGQIDSNGSFEWDYSFSSQGSSYYPQSSLILDDESIYYIGSDSSDYYVAKLSFNPVDTNETNITVSTTNITFTEQVIDTNTSASVTVTNNGNVDINASDMNITGSNSSEFFIAGDCNTTLLVGNSCNIDVIFAPRTGGDKNATFQINDGNTTHYVSLFGVATDGDGIPDIYELANDLNISMNDAALDKDNDGRTNLQEYQNGTKANDFNSQVMDIYMQEGWKLLAFPLNVSYDLSNMNNQDVEVIRSLQNDKWYTWTRDNNATTDLALTTLEDGYGYWVKSSQDTIIEIKGDGLPDANITIVPGKWNMLGSVIIDDIDTFFIQNPNLKVIWTYTVNNPSFWSASSSDPDIAQSLLDASITEDNYISSSDVFFVK
ncbi:choice-of-anchor D domain-containing protein [Sulfurimonas sp.]|nr:choice-of-anchor D domain-containing protein [Sulfurimonas sp.]